MKKLIMLVIVSVVLFANTVFAYQKADKFRYPLDSYNVGCNDFWGTCVAKYHTAEDANASAGTVVKSPANGKVVFADFINRYGGVILIEHDTGSEKIVSVLGHMDKSTFKVQSGDEIELGKELGKIGINAEDINGGWSPHLHYGIHKGEYDGGGEKKCDKWTYAGYVSCSSVKADWYDPSDFIKENTPAPANPKIFCAKLSDGYRTLCWKTSDAVNIYCEQALDWSIYDYKKNQSYPAKKSDCENQCYQKKTSFNQITDFVFTPAYASTPVDSCAYESEGDFDTIVDSDNDGIPDSQDCQPFNNLIFPGQEEICQDGIDNDCSNGDAKCNSGDDPNTDLWSGYKNPFGLEYVRIESGSDYKNETSYYNTDIPNKKDFKIKIKRKGSKWPSGDICAKIFLAKKDSKKWRSTDNELGKKDCSNVAKKYPKDKEKNFYVRDAEIKKHIQEPGEYRLYTIITNKHGSNISSNDNSKEYVKITITRHPNDIDNDGDGYTENQGDCNDGNSSIYPNAQDIPDNGIDEDCDGQDDADPKNNQDNDGDGFTSAEGDKDDANPNIYPGAPEICGNDVDENGDGVKEICPKKELTPAQKAAIMIILGD